jgi:DNA-binding transcriptional ArsR family regulator
MSSDLRQPMLNPSKCLCGATEIGKLVVTMTHALDALGSPVRRQILQELRHKPLSVVDLAGLLPVSRPAVSRHLRILDDAGLVEARQEGTRSLYAVRVQGFAGVREFVDQFWDVALARLEMLAKR